MRLLRIFPPAITIVLTLSLTNLLEAKNKSLKIISKTRELIYYQEDKEFPCYLLTPDAPVTVKVSGPAELITEIRINITPVTKITDKIPFFVRVEDLPAKRYHLPPPVVSPGVYLGETSFFPAVANRLKLNISEKEQMITFSIDKSATGGATLSFVNLPEQEEETYISKISLGPFIGGGGVSDSYGKQLSGSISAGIGINYDFAKRFFLSASFGADYYSQIYYSFTQDDENLIQSGPELKLNINSHAGFILLKRRAFELSPLLGFSGNFFFAGNFNNILLGPSAGVEPKFILPWQSDLIMRITYTYDLVKERSGDKKPVSSYPYSSLDYSVRAELKRIFFGYRGAYLLYPRVEKVEWINNVETRTKFPLNHRFYHSLFAGVSF